MPPEDTDLKHPNGKTPILLRTLTEEAVQGSRLPLSRSLRPTRPPEERERGASGAAWTLKAALGREGEKTRSYCKLIWGEQCGDADVRDLWSFVTSRDSLHSRLLKMSFEYESFDDI
jgi:hypothetical protein